MKMQLIGRQETRKSCYHLICFALQGVCVCVCVCVAMVTSPERVMSPVAHYSSLLDEIVGCGDMVLLDPITMETVLHNLKQRYQAKEIYVSMFMCIIAR